MAFVEQHTNIQ